MHTITVQLAHQVSLMKRSNISFGILSGTLAVLLMQLSMGCQFRAPSIAEQRELIAKGSFPQGVPSWIPQAALNQKFPRRSPLGVLPVSYVKPPRTSSLFKGLNDPSRSTSLITRTEIAARERLNKQDASEASVEEKEASPFNRVVQLCPSIESDVSSMLTTSDPAQKTSKLESLSNRCPNSSDLQFWLAQAYIRQGKSVKAHRSLERAVLLDPKNDQAKALLKETRDKLNQPDT